jgi:hypothetical protein
MEGKFCYGRTHTIRDSAQRRGEHGRAVPRWYKTEKAEISKLEKGKRLAANKVFLERIEREVRLGGRMAIIADLRIPDLPQGVATVVNVHLENKCKPECRIKHMDAALSNQRSGASGDCGRRLEYQWDRWNADVDSPGDSQSREELRILGNAGTEMGDTGVSTPGGVDAGQLFQELSGSHINPSSSHWKQQGGHPFPARRAVSLRRPNGF